MTIWPTTWRTQERDWHLWFAWHPVRVQDDDSLRWLERVHRKVERLHSMDGSMPVRLYRSAR